MKSQYIIKQLTIMLFLCNVMISYSNDFPSLIPEINKVKMNIGETYQLPLTMKSVENAESDTINVSITWSVEPDTLGSINEFAVFTAEKLGEGYLIADYNTIVKQVELEIEDKDITGNYGELPKITIVPGNVKVELGDSLELYAFYVDSLDRKIDTTFTWSVSSQELGTFSNPEIPVFQSNNIGKGIVTASLGELADSIKLEVYESKWKKDKNNGNNGKKLIIAPGDTIVLADAGIIQYIAKFKSNGNSSSNYEITWSVSDTSIAAINSDGLLTLKGETGLTLVSAFYNNFQASVELLVIDPLVDPNVNIITIHRVLPDGKVLNPKVFKEGESYKIGGLPYPINILNSGMLHFPYGCISEDIIIYMKIPEDYSVINDSTSEVEFSDEIITGVEFNVQPVASDTIVHPFWFHIPVELKLTFKRGLLKSLGVDPYDIDIFFAENTQFIPVGDVVATVDTSSNSIYAGIEHFSTIVVRKSNAASSIKNLPQISNDWLNIYPNPTKTDVTFQFYLAEAGKVKIEVYNLNGQKIKFHTNQKYEKGIHQILWKGNDSSGIETPSGIYFCRFIVNENINQIKKLIINR